MSDKSARGAYNWKPAVTPEYTAEEMQARGQRAVPTNRGTVFASRPGAPSSVNDSMVGLGVTAPIGSAAHDAAWSNFFKQPTLPAAPVPPTGASDVAADENFGGGTNAAPAAAAAPDPVAASIQANQSWMQSRGVAFPPPPTPRAPLYQTGTNQIVKPSLNNDPARTAGGGVSPSALAAPAMAFNRSLYAAADTLPGGAGYAQAPGSSVPTGWVSTTASQADAIRQRYGT